MSCGHSIRGKHLECPFCVATLAKNHAIEALRWLARQKKCEKSNCGTVCLCQYCHARKALDLWEVDYT